MSMKLSRRDKVILLCVIVAAIGIAGYLLLLKPKYAEMQASNDRLAAKEAERSEVEEKIATLEVLKKRLEDDVKSVVEDQKEFLSEEEVFEPQHISTYIMNMLEPSGINITGMSVPALTPNTLSAYTYNKNALAYEMRMNADLARELPEEVYYAYNGSYPAPPPAVVIGLSTVTVDFEFETGEQLYDAIQLVADDEKDIYLINVSSQEAGDGAPGVNEEETPKGQMIIEVYTITPLDPDDIDKDPASAE
ncbi:MAG: hypothetical protein K2N72_03835 [Oscillospiraceae bacterium]|nr:hypothetical protein [Oscillospiraceae bacterium]